MANNGKGLKPDGAALKWLLFFLLRARALAWSLLALFILAVRAPATSSRTHALLVDGTVAVGEPRGAPA